MSLLINDDSPSSRWYIQSKLLPPKPPVRMFAKQEMAMRLAQDVALTILDAPAGYGKTTVLLQGLEQLKAVGRQVCWLSLDEEDRAPEQFIAYIILSLKTANVALPHLEEAAIARLADIEYKKVIKPLLLSIAQHKLPLILVMDDYHHVTGSVVDEIMNLILNYQPHNLTFIVAGRGRPGFKFEQQRASGHAVVIDKSELAFSPAEISTYFSGALTEAETQILALRSQGWPAAIQLAMLWLDRNKEAMSSLSSFSGRTKELASYLAEQVFLALPDITKDFLLHTAILDVVEGHMAIALTGRQDALLLLEELELKGLPILSLNEERTRFRYHHLFSEFLYNQLRRSNPSLLHNLHSKASLSYVKSGDKIQAARHAAAAGNANEAAACLERAGGWYQVMRGKLWNLLEFRDLPDSAFSAHPQLRLAQIHLMAREGMVLEARQAYNELKALTDDFNSSTGRDWNIDVRIDSIIVEMGLKIYEAKPIKFEEVKSLTHVIECSHRKDKMLSVICRHMAVISYYDFGDLQNCCEAATPLFREWHAAETLSMANYMACYRARALFGLGKALAAEDVLMSILAEMSQFFAEASRSGAVAPLLLAEIKYEQGDTEPAKRLMGQSFSRIIDVEVWFDLETSTYRTAAMLAFHEKGAEEALKILDIGIDAAIARGVELTVRYLDILRHHILILSARTSEAKAILEKPFVTEILNTPTTEKMAAWQLSHAIKISYSRHLIMEEKYNEARELLLPLIMQLRIMGHNRYLLDALILALFTEIDSEQTEKLLAEAIDLARPEGFIRPFFDAGPDFAALAQKLLKSYSVLTIDQAAYLQKLLKHGDISDNNGLLVQTDSNLSPREQEILEMMSAGLSSKEIAVALGVAESTVKTHRKNLYRKLGVHRRSSAIAKLIAG